MQDAACVHSGMLYAYIVGKQKVENERCCARHPTLRFSLVLYYPHTQVVPRGRVRFWRALDATAGDVHGKIFSVLSGSKPVGWSVSQRHKVHCFHIARAG